MKVMLVSDVHSEMRGGVPVETRALAEGLIRAGHRVTLVADVPMRVAGLQHHALSVGSLAGYEGELAAAIRCFQPDVVHVMAMSTPGLLACQRAFRTLPWLFTCHSLSPYERVLRQAHGSEFLHYTARALRFLPNSLAWRWVFLRGAVPLAIVHSGFVRDCAHRYGLPSARIELISLGCAPPSTWTVTPRPVVEEAPRLMTIAGIAHTKGLHDALCAIARVRRRWHGLRYDVVGEVRDPTYLRHLLGLVDSLGLGDTVRFHVDAPEALKTDLLSSADLYLQPSHEEGFCLSFGEGAAAVGRVVGTSAGAMGDMRSPDDASMRIVGVGDAGAIECAVAELLTCPVLPAHLEARARWFGQRFSWDAYVGQHLALYGRLEDRDPALVRA